MTTISSNIPSLPKITPLQAKQMADYVQPSTDKPTHPPIYASPVYKFDSLAKINIELIRDTSTGNVINQIPPQQVIEKYRLGLMTANTAGMNARTPSFTPPTPVSLPTTNSK